MGRSILSLTLCLALIVAAFGHAMASHHGHAPSAINGAAMVDQAMNTGHGGHDCDRSCNTADVADCCGKTIAHCTGTMLGAAHCSGAANQNTAVAEFFAGNRPLSGSPSTFDPPPPKV